MQWCCIDMVKILSMCYITSCLPSKALSACALNTVLQPKPTSQCPSIFSVHNYLLDGAPQSLLKQYKIWFISQILWHSKTTSHGYVSTMFLCLLCRTKIFTAIVYCVSNQRLTNSLKIFMHVFWKIFDRILVPPCLNPQFPSVIYIIIYTC